MARTRVGDLAAWISDNFHLSPDGAVCKRCGMTVTYVTKHAVERHGDNIDVEPITPNHLADPKYVIVW